jgi:transcription elongation factor GreA
VAKRRAPERQEDLMDTIEMTAGELQRLREELNDLESGGRAGIAARIKTAREWGDLKENGEYHAAKEAQAHLETRILRLREQVRAAVVVDEATSGGAVRHGATVEVTDLGKGTTQSFKIVSPNEANPKEGLISSASPVAQALIGKSAGDEVEISIPAGVRKLRIDSIA